MRKNSLQKILSGMALLCLSLHITIKGASSEAYSVGNLSGQLTVSDMGAAVYSLNFDVPDGGPLTPQIGIAYNSQTAGYGLAGYGFNITGISCITRGGKDLFHDQTVQGVTYTDEDNYFLDGKRLILKEGQQGKDGSKYCLEGDPYTEILMHNRVKTTYIVHDPGTGDEYFEGRIPYYVPDSLVDRTDETIFWFEVEAQGIISVYGKNDDSKQIIGTKNNKKIEHAWYISSVKDQFNNCTSYEYANESLLVLPKNIRFGKKYRISFSYQSLGDNAREFSIAGKIGVLNKCLSSTTIMDNNNNTFRKYFFEYEDSSIQNVKKWNFLTRIAIANGQGEMFPPILLDWNKLQKTDYNSSQLNFEQEIDSNREIKEQYAFATDFSNDGISDLVEIRHIQTKAYNGEKYDAVDILFSKSKRNEDNSIYYENCAKQVLLINSPYVIASNIVNDFDGDGYTDIIIPFHAIGDKKIVFKWYSGRGLAIGMDPQNCSSFFELKLTQETTEVPLISFSDVDGDGKEEIICSTCFQDGLYYEGALIPFAFSAMHIIKYVESYGDTVITKQLLLPFQKQNDYYEPVIKKLFVGDFTNNSLNDLMVINDDCYYIYPNNGGNDFEKTYSFETRIRGNSLCDHYKMEQGDFNGDGLTDFVYYKSHEKGLWLAINEGEGRFSNKNMSLDNCIIPYDNNIELLVNDYNHDGLSDVVLNYVNKDKNKVRTLWLSSKGTKLTIDKLCDFSDSEKKTFKLFIGDFNGDGFYEPANFDKDIISNTTNKAKVNVYNLGRELSSLNKIVRVLDGLKNATEIEYSSGTNPSVYSRNKLNYYPNNYYTLPIALVSQLTCDNGTSEKAKQIIKYEYQNLQVNLKGRGILGFSSTTQKNVTWGTKTVSTIVKRDPERLIPTEVRREYFIDGVSSLQIKRYDITVPKTTAFGSGGKTYFPYVYRTDMEDFDGNVTTTVRNYDLYRGVVAQDTVYDDGGDMYKVVAYDNYDYKGGAYRPKDIITTQKHKDDSAPFITRTSYTYDDKGNTLTSVTNSASSMPVTTTMTYDKYGNMESSVTTGQGVKPIKTYYEYDDTKRFVTKTFTEPASSVLTYTYDVWGNVLTETDSTNTAFPLTTRHQYDAWGRKTSTTNALGLMTQYETGWGSNDDKGWGSNDDKKYYTIVKAEGQAPDTTWYDKLGREVLHATVGLQGISISTSTHYNGKGQVDEVVNRQGNLQVTNQYTYDARGRVTDETSSTGSSTHYEYGNRRTETTVAGRRTTTTYDAWGNVVKVVDPISNITYKYCSNGQPKSVTSGSTTVTMTYDEVGNQIKLVDPDAGTMTYSYAADGTLLTQTDTRGVETIFERDALGRDSVTSFIDAKNGSRKKISYTYGKAGNELHQLVKQEMDDNVLEYTHDGYGRVKTEKRTIGNYGVFEFKYDYDQYGRLAEKLYPGGLKESFQYDEKGFKTHTFANGMIIYKVDDYDGMVKKTSFVESLKRTITRDDKGYLSQKQIALGSTDIEGIDFTYDVATGNLLSRQRNYGLKYEAKENFHYDALDRLDTVRTGKTISLAMKYAANGNILSKSDVGQFNYDDMSHPHAVTRLMTPVIDQEINDALNTKFNVFGKVERISDTRQALTMNFGYGPDQHRWYSRLMEDQFKPLILGKESEISDFSNKQVSVANLNFLPRTTIYADNYEKVTENDVIREFYYLDGGVIVVKQNGQFTPYIAFTDNLGSILSVYSTDGTKVFDASYDVWGRQTVTLNKIGLRRGYTGHEMLNEFGIINMNGRLYDPVLGRFFSPDNYVQAPCNSQNFNRYTYCLNNPLKYNDPSGELFTEIFCAYLMAYIGGVEANFFKCASKNTNPFNPGNWDLRSISTYTGIIMGAVSGADMAGANLSSELGMLSNVDGIITRGVTMASINVGVNGIDNLMHDKKFFNNWQDAAITGFINGAISGYELAVENGTNYWWGNDVAYNRTAWSLINTNLPDEEIFFDIKNVGSINENDCVPTTFLEASKHFGDTYSYDDFKAATSYETNVGVELNQKMGEQLMNKLTINEKITLEYYKCFDPEYMKNLKNSGDIVTFHFYKHMDNVRSLQVFYKIPTLNKLTFRQSRFNYDLIKHNQSSKTLNIYRVKGMKPL